MEDSTLDNLPENIREKVIQSRKAFAMSSEIEELLNFNFSICDLRVASTFDKIVSISGLIDNEVTKRKLIVF